MIHLVLMLLLMQEKLSEPVDIPPMDCGRVLCPYSPLRDQLYPTGFTCYDKTRFLMTSEDGAKHCIKLTDTTPPMEAKSEAIPICNTVSTPRVCEIQLSDADYWRCHITSRVTAGVPHTSTACVRLYDGTAQRLSRWIDEQHEEWMHQHPLNYQCGPDGCVAGFTYLGEGTNATTVSCDETDTCPHWDSYSPPVSKHHHHRPN